MTTRTRKPFLSPAALLGLCGLLTACSGPSRTGAQGAEARLVDLTHPFGADTIYWPTADPFVLTKGPEGMTPGGYFYNANSFCAAEHGGTHLDAPYHFREGRQKVGDIPVERFFGPGIVVDVARQSETDRDYLVSIPDFEDWESRNGRIPPESIVLLRTGYHRYWPDAETYLGTAQRGADAVPKLHFPGLAPDAAQWLSDERSIKAVGIDTASIDYGQSQSFRTHVALADKNVLILENVALTDDLPASGFEVIALPMKIAQGSGAPLRIVARIPAKK